MSARADAGPFAARNVPGATPDWKRAAYLTHVSRALDELEETQLVPARAMFYQFSARGHDVAQILLGLKLTRSEDAVCGYYRSRPVLLAMGLSLDDALGSSMARSGGWWSRRETIRSRTFWSGVRQPSSCAGRTATTSGWPSSSERWNARREPSIGV